MIVFFNTENRKTILLKFVQKIDEIEALSDFEIKRNSIIRLVLDSIYKSPDYWDKTCQINIEWFGEQFISQLSDVKRIFTKEDLDDICSVCFRFILEMYLSTKGDLSREFESARRYVVANIDLFQINAKEQIEFALKEMPIAIFKAIANSDSIDSIKEFNSVSILAKKLKEQWDNEISEKEKNVKSLKESLDKYENAFNFVGLHQGFDDMSRVKLTEKGNIFIWLIVLGTIIILPILTEIIVILSNIQNINNIRDGLIASILPTFSFVGISIYYFKILLFNYKAVNSQILQIELRKTLCRFIQNYSDYSIKIKKQDPESLAKFENIIFANILSDDDKLPSSYDGIEQISNLIKSFKQ